MIQRGRRELNPRIRVLQTPALPLGYVPSGQTINRLPPIVESDKR